MRTGHLRAGDGPDLARETLGLGAGGRAVVAAAVADRIDHRTRGGDERARRAGRERRGDVGRRAALRTDARAAGAPTAAGGSRASATSRGNVAPTTAPTADKPALADEVARPTRARAGDVLPEPCRRRRARRPARPRSPEFDVLTRQKMPAPSRRHASRNGSTESPPRYGFTVTASASGGRRPGSMNAAAYARAVEPMSPRFASAMTSSPARVRTRTPLRTRERRPRRAPRRTPTAASPRPHAARLRRRSRGRSAQDGRSLRPSCLGLVPQAVGQLLDDRVEPDDELALLPLDRFGEPVGEMRHRHRRADLEILRHAAKSTARVGQTRNAREAALAASRRSSEETCPSSLWLSRP